MRVLLKHNPHIEHHIITRAAPAVNRRRVIVSLKHRVIVEAEP
jgi:hypothetical protein